MYGMVNQGVQSFITKNFGQADWLDICDRAGVSDTQFEGMLTYPDEVTYKLVGAICEKYDMSAEDALENFGAYWIDFSRTTSVGKLIRFGGQELADLLDSLNDMHSRIKRSMPHLQPPHFELEEHEDGTYHLHYSSDREGLEHMVIGLVKGLAKESSVEIEISQDPEPAYDGVRASFSVRLV